MMDSGTIRMLETCMSRPERIRKALGGRGSYSAGPAVDVGTPRREGSATFFTGSLTEGFVRRFDKTSSFVSFARYLSGPCPLGWQTSALYPLQ